MDISVNKDVLKTMVEEELQFFLTENRDGPMGDAVVESEAPLDSEQADEIEARSTELWGEIRGSLGEARSKRPGITMKPALRKKLNKVLEKYNSSGPDTYHRHIPLGDIFGGFRKLGVVALQEDNTEWSGFLLGKKGSASLDLAPLDSKNDKGFFTPFNNSTLQVQWYKMDSGKFELNSYVS